MRKIIPIVRSLALFRRERLSGGSPAALLGRSVLLLTCVLTGCVVGPKYHAPAVQAPAAYKESPTQFKESGPWAVAQPQDAKLRGAWWEIFNDPELNALEKQLNIDNQNIKRFFENFMEARTLIRQARSQYFPTVGTTPAFTRQHSSANLGNSANSANAGGSGGATNSGQVSNFYSLPFDVSWVPDLWGKVRNEVRASQYSAQVSAADLENERLTEQANLAQYFFEIRGQDALIQLYASTIKADQNALDRTRALYETGVDDKISMIEAQNTLESAQSAATNLGILRAQYEHAMAVLVGKAASSFSIPFRPITTAPPPIPIGMPSLLLERRPDVAAAERTMAAANAQIGISYAAYYPTLTISASGAWRAPCLSACWSGPAGSGQSGPRSRKPSMMEDFVAPR